MKPRSPLYIQVSSSDRNTINFIGRSTGVAMHCKIFYFLRPYIRRIKIKPAVLESACIYLETINRATRIAKLTTGLSLKYSRLHMAR